MVHVLMVLIGIRGRGEQYERPAAARTDGRDIDVSSDASKNVRLNDKWVKCRSTAKYAGKALNPPLNLKPQLFCEPLSSPVHPNFDSLCTDAENLACVPMA